MQLELQDLSAFYGDAQALWGVDLIVPAGGVVAVIGANGAGKSTVLRAISGTVRVGSGRIRLGETDLRAIPASRIIAAGIAHVPEGRRLFGNMSVRENLLVGAFGTAHWATRKTGLEEAYALFPRLRERESQMAGSLSGGEQQMVAIARALMARPSILMLDEPSLGLAPKIVELIFETLQAIVRNGTSLLLVEQNARLALQVARTAYVMAHGRIVAGGEASSLASGDLRAAYLGI